MAARAGITRQSMGEVIRDMVGSGSWRWGPTRTTAAPSWSPTPRRAENAREGYRHILDLEKLFADEVGEDYEAARRVLERVVAILDADNQD